MATTVNCANQMTIEQIESERFAQDVWGYARDNANSLNSTQHIAWIEQKTKKLIDVCDRRALAFERKYKAMFWFVENIERGKRLFPKNASNSHKRSKEHDKEICHAAMNLGASITMIAKVFHTSAGIVKQVLLEHGHPVEGFACINFEEKHANTTA